MFRVDRVNPLAAAHQIVHSRGRPAPATHQYVKNQKKEKNCDHLFLFSFFFFFSFPVHYCYFLRSYFYFKHVLMSSFVLDLDSASHLTGALARLFERSLFERFEQAGFPVHMLTTQYCFLYPVLL